MTRGAIILGIFCFLLTSRIFCQVEANQYEVEFEQLLQKNNPAYYNGLQRVLSKYEQELISVGVIKDGSFNEIRRLLKRISEEGKIDFSTSYDLEASIKELGDGISEVFRTMERRIIARKYWNDNNSKDFIYDRMISEMIRDTLKWSRSKDALALLEVFDEKDFELLLVKHRFFHLINPNSKRVRYVYVGRPTLKKKNDK